MRRRGSGGSRSDAGIERSSGPRPRRSRRRGGRGDAADKPRGATPASTDAPRAPRPSPREGDDGSPLPKAVGDIVAVIPLWVKLLVAAVGVLALLLAAAYSLSRARATRLRRQREALLEDVGLLQAALLPGVPGWAGGLPVSVAYRPSGRLAAGGDFYDAFELDDDRIAFVVGDVSGHGREALSRTTLVHYTLRAYLDAGLEPRRVLGLTDQAVGDDLGEEFVTVVVATYDPSSGELTYASAGHPPPIVSGPVEHEPVTVLSSPPIGTGLLPTGRRQTRIRLPAACAVCLYTDGLVEAQVDGALLGRDRLAEMLVGLETKTAAQSLIDAVHDESDDASDDMAACVFSTGEQAAGDGRRLEELEVDEMTSDNDLERFLEACGVSSDDISAAVSRARSAAADSSTAVLRVAIAGGESVAEAEPARRPALVAG